MTFDKNATLLAIDTSSPACSVALRYQGNLFEQYEPDARKHTQELLPLTDALLKVSGVNPNQVEGIIISAGPGAFTGLRIGAAVALGLSAAWQIPILPISSLALLAATATRLTGEKRILATMDARMNEVYVARFEMGKNISKEWVCPPEALPPEWLCDVLVAGSGIIYQDRLPSSESTRFASEEILPAAQDAFFILDQNENSHSWLPAGSAIELNYLRNEVTQK